MESLTSHFGVGELVAHRDIVVAQEAVVDAGCGHLHAVGDEGLALGPERRDEGLVVSLSTSITPCCPK